MRRGVWIALSSALAICLPWAASCEKKAPASAASLFVDTKFERVSAIEGFSRPVQAFLAERFVGGIAGPGEPFEETDVTGVPPLPPRRLIEGGKAGNLEFIWYEAGGIGKHQHLVLLKTTHGATEPILVARGLYCSSLGDLKKLVASGKFEDETSNPFEW